MDLVKAGLTAAGVWLAMAGFRHYKQLTVFQRAAFLIAIAITAIRGCVRIGLTVAGNTQQPPFWDFLLFWVNGTMARRGLNFYDSALAMQVAALHPDLAFDQIVFPFLYPPPSVLWFVPLGWMDAHTAIAVWYGAQLACLVTSAVVLSLIFFGELLPIGLPLTTALLLLIRATYWNLEHAQTVFLLLLCLSLGLYDCNRTRGGVWLGLAMLVKPFAAVMMLYLIVFRKWRQLLASLVTVAAATLVTFLIWGTGVFASYAAIRFSLLPRTSFTEMENQSLLAWILRITQAPNNIPGFYVLIAGMCFLVLAWRLLAARQTNELTGFVLALTWGILLYPASLRSYLVLLILPLLVLYRARLWIPAALACGLMYPQHGDYAMLATALIAVTLTVRMPGAAVEAAPQAERPLAQSA